jgi:flagellar basal body P-ring formation protein FlgA
VTFDVTTAARMALRAAAAFSLAACQGASAAAPDGAVRIDLPEKIQVAREKVTLGDVAGIATQDAELLRRLMALGLGNAPRAGEAASLDRDTLGQWIQRHARLDGKNIVWTGAPKVVVSSETQNIDCDAVLQAARNTLNERIAAPERTVELKPLAVDCGTAIPIGAATYKTRGQQSEQLKKRMVEWVDAYVDGRFVRAIPVQFEVGAWGPARVSLVDAKAGAALNEGNTEVRLVDLTQQRHAVSTGALSEGQRVRARTFAGETVAAKSIESAPDVLRGEWLPLTSQSGAVSLESKVEVLQDGRTGQIVRVKRGEGKASFAARVAGPGRLETLQ